MSSTWSTARGGFLLQPADRESPFLSQATVSPATEPAMPPPQTEDILGSDELLGRPFEFEGLLDRAGDLLAKVVLDYLTRERARWQQIRQEAVRIAQQEYAAWGRGTLVENDSARRADLLKYWKPTGMTYTGPDVWQNSWSAAFISWVLQEAGAGSAFPASFRHSRYVHWAIQNAHRSRVDPIVGYRVDKFTPRPGDLLSYWTHSKYTYEDFAAATQPPQQNMHTDLVTYVASTHVLAIGGNKPPQPGTRCPLGHNSCTVNEVRYDLDAARHLEPLKFTPGNPRGWVAVIRIGWAP